MGDHVQNINSFEELLGDSRRRTADLASVFLLEHPEHFDEALNIALSDKPATSMRAARVVQLASGEDPGLLIGHTKRIIDLLPELKEQGAQRSLIKAMIPIVGKLDEEELGPLAQTCFNWLEDSSTPPAIYVYSLEIIYGISNLNPDMKSELVSFLQLRKDERSPGIKSKSAAILKKLHKEIIGKNIQISG